jgi:hypothetical protein
MPLFRVSALELIAVYLDNRQAKTCVRNEILSFLYTSFYDVDSQH